MGKTTKSVAKTSSKNPRAQFRPDPHNLRQHPEANKALIRQSLEEVGPFRSIGVDGEGIIRAGNGVYEQAEALGLKIRVVQAEPDELIAVQRADLIGDKAERAALYDNKTAETSEWDTAQLAAIIAVDRERLAGIFSESELSALKRITSEEQQREKSDSAALELATADLVKRWKVKSGQVWAIPSRYKGEHYLYIGDCTESIPSKFGQCISCITSPPYAEQRKQKYGGIPVDQYVEWWANVQHTVRGLLQPDASFFVNLKAHCEQGERTLYAMDLVLSMQRQHGWKFVDELIWVKPGYPGDMGRRFKNGFEPIYHFATTLDYPFHLDQVVDYRQSNFGGYSENLASVQGRRGTDNTHDLDSVRPSNVLHLMPDQTRLEKVGGHPARFPPSLPEFFIKASSVRGERILDPFAGSGTTGIVCEELGRLAALIEVDVGYSSVILERFKVDYGVTARCIATV